MIYPITKHGIFVIKKLLIFFELFMHFLVGSDPEIFYTFFRIWQKIYIASSAWRWFSNVTLMSNSKIKGIIYSLEIIFAKYLPVRLFIQKFNDANNSPLFTFDSLLFIYFRAFSFKKQITKTFYSSNLITIYNSSRVNLFLNF